MKASLGKPLKMYGVILKTMMTFKVCTGSNAAGQKTGKKEKKSEQVQTIKFYTNNHGTFS